MSILERGIFYRLAEGARRDQQAPATGAAAAPPARPSAPVGRKRHRQQAFRGMERAAGEVGEDRFQDRAASRRCKKLHFAMMLCTRVRVVSALT